MKYTPKSNFNYTEVLSDASKLTIKDIFDLTPAPEDVIIGCQTRKNAYNVNSYSHKGMARHCSKAMLLWSALPKKTKLTVISIV